MNKPRQYVRTSCGYQRDRITDPRNAIERRGNPYSPFNPIDWFGIITIVSASILIFFIGLA